MQFTKPQILCLLFLTFITCSGIYAQSPSGLGEGKVEETIYYHVPAISQDEAIKNVGEKDIHTVFFQAIYWIKRDKVLRDDTPLDSIKSRPITTNSSSVTTTLSTDIVHYKFLIDLKKREAYNFYKEKGQPAILKNSLDSQKIEFNFRRNRDTYRPLYDNSDSIYFIARVPSFKEHAIDDIGDTCTFFFSDKYMGVLRSPLNDRFPKDFRHNILAIVSPAHSNNPIMKIPFFDVLKITEFKPLDLCDSLFVLPRNVPVKEMPFDSLLSKNYEEMKYELLKKIK